RYHRDRDELFRRANAVDIRREVAAQDRRRTENRRWVQYLRLDRGNPARDREQEHFRRFQAKLVGAAATRKHGHCRILAAMQPKSEAQMVASNIVVRGTPALATDAKQ